jgi:hypothetical protein
MSYSALTSAPFDASDMVDSAKRRIEAKRAIVPFDASTHRTMRQEAIDAHAKILQIKREQDAARAKRFAEHVATLGPSIPELLQALVVEDGIARIELTRLEAEAISRILSQLESE